MHKTLEALALQVTNAEGLENKEHFDGSAAWKSSVASADASFWECSSLDFQGPSLCGTQIQAQFQKIQNVIIKY